MKIPLHFIEDHWGDLIGLLLLYTGVVLALIATTWLGGAQPLNHLGESLVLAGMGVLKLRGKSESSGDDAQKQKRNENGNETPASGAGPAGNV